MLLSTDGGSFVIANEDTDIYQLRLIIEHTTSPHTEIGYVLEDYIYDTQNDRIGVVLHSDEGIETVWFTRQSASEPFGDIAGRYAAADDSEMYFEIKADGAAEVSINAMSGYAKYSADELSVTVDYARKKLLWHLRCLYRIQFSARLLHDCV